MAIGGGTELGADGQVLAKWSLVKVLDVVAVVLVSVVAARAVAGLVAAFGYPAATYSAAVSGGVGKVVPSLPGYIRLQYGTGWVDAASGLLLLGCVGLLALPRVVWDVGPEDRGLRISPALVAVAGTVAAITAIAGVVGLVNTFHNLPGISDSSEAPAIADLVAGTALAALAAVLSWHARGFVGAEAT